MKLTHKTITLLIVVLLLLGLNVVDQGTDLSIGEDLPTLPALPSDALTRIEISNAQQKLVMRSEDGMWQVIAPFTAKADQAQVASLLQAFRKEVPIDVRVDRDNPEQYGLDAGNGIVVEFWTSGEDPVSSIIVGFDAPGGSSFLRLSGDDAVYRARIGGRSRYEQPAIAWRNRVLMDYAVAEVAAFQIETAAHTLRFVRGPSPGTTPDGEVVPGMWSMEPDPGMDIDQRAIEAMVRTFGLLRAGGLLGEGFDAGFSPPRAVLTATLQDGSTRQLIVGTRRQDRAAFVQVAGADDVYQVSARAIDLALQEPAAFLDRTIFTFRREDVDILTLEEGTHRILIQQDTATGFWSVIQPANIDLDLKRVYFMVNTLADLRAVALSDVSLLQAGLSDPDTRLTARFLDGEVLTLELGSPTTDEAGKPAFFARRADTQQVYVLDRDTVVKLKQGFGRE